MLQDLNPTRQTKRTTGRVGTGVNRCALVFNELKLGTLVFQRGGKPWVLINRRS